MKSKCWLKAISYMLAVLTVVVTIPFTIVGGGAASLTDDEVKMAQALLGLGYNVTAGKALEKSVLLKANTILDMNNKDLLSHVYVAKIGKQTSSSGFAYSALAVAEAMGSTLSGGIQAQIKVVNVNIGASYAKTKSVKNATEERYEYYYTEIFNKQLGFRGLSLNDYRSYLSPQFDRDIKSISSVEEAKILLAKYGTHLFTGYNLGGRLDITNYQQRNSTQSSWASDMSLSEQVGVAVSQYGGSENFSFSQQFGGQQNSSSLTSEYKCQTLGGVAIASLTVDSLFTYNASITGTGKYEYARWIDSINNDNGELLDIVGVPEDGAAIPLWDLLPDNGNYNLQRLYIIRAYTEMCGDKYSEYVSQLPKLNKEVGSTETAESGRVSITGYYLNEGGIYSCYEDDGAQKAIEVQPGTTILMTYDNFTKLDNFDMLEWTVSGGGASSVRISDVVTGVFTVEAASAKVGQTFTVSACVNGKECDNREFKIVKKEFSGGRGTEERPFIISTLDDWRTIGNPQYCGEEYYYQLVNDIDLKNSENVIIGDSRRPFRGTLNGNYCAIKNFSINRWEYIDLDPENGYGHVIGTEVGLFGCNKGTIKNLKVEKPQINLNINRLNDTSAVLNYVSVGALVGINKGILENCIVSYPSISVKYTNAEGVSFKKNDKDIYRLGGLVGYCEESNISKCGVENPALLCNSKVTSGEHYYTDISIGGFAGESKDSEFSYDYEIANDITHILFDSQVTGKTSWGFSSIYAKQYTGGMIGQSYGKLIVDNCIVDYPNVVFLHKDCDKDTKNDLYFGSIVGFVNKEDEKEVNLKNSYAKRCVDSCITTMDGDGSKVIPNGRVYGNKSALSGVTTTGTSEKDSITECKNLDSSVWVKNQNKYPVIADFAFQSYAMKVEGNMEKSAFNRAFRPDISGDFKVTVTSGNGSGDPIQLKYYRISSATFKPKSVATYTISVSGAGIFNSQTYKTEVVKKTAVSIRAKDVATADLWVGDSYDVNSRSFEIVVAYSNGEIAFERPSASSLNAKDHTLTDGINYITLEYQNCSCEFPVNAIMKTVTKLELIQEQTNSEYWVGDLFNPAGMVVKATYSNNKIETVDPASLEIIGDRIVEGENKIIISYGPYVTLEEPISVIGIKRDSTTESETNPAIEPPTEPETDSETDPVKDQETEFTTANGTESVTDPIKDPITDPTDIAKIADVNGDGSVTYDDAVLLLRFIHFPKTNPISTGSGDVDGDMRITSDDAIYLCHYIFSPNEYPIGGRQ